MPNFNGWIKIGKVSMTFMVVVVVELHSSWKYVILIKLQLNCNELHGIYNKSCNLFNSTQNIKIWWVTSDDCNSKSEL